MSVSSLGPVCEMASLPKNEEEHEIDKSIECDRSQSGQQGTGAGGLTVSGHGRRLSGEDPGRPLHGRTSSRSHGEDSYTAVNTAVMCRRGRREGRPSEEGEVGEWAIEEWSLWETAEKMR